MEVIIAEDIVRRHRTGRGIDGVSVSVEAGRCLGVLGANGSGKTTLTRMVAGLDRADSGRLLVLGEAAYPRRSCLRGRCGVALDTASHWDGLSGRANLWFFARQYGLGGAELTRRVDELLFEADLAGQADEPVGEYSFGMRRKLSIIEAMAHDPDLLILDEPSAGADVAFLERLVEWIEERCERGKTTWIADNDADWLGRAATDAILLCDGRAAAGGDVAELLASVEACNRVEIVLAESGFDAVPAIDGIVEFNCDEKRIRADMGGNPELPAELLGWITASGGRVRSMEVRSITLHEALLQRASRGEAAK